MGDTTAEAIRQEKTRLRREALARRLAMSPEEVAERGAIIAERVLALAKVRNAPLVLSYVEKPGTNEVPTTPILQALLDRGQHIAVPRVEGSELVWHEVRELGDLRPGAYGIPEPNSDPESVIRHWLSGAVCLVPGVCWTMAGDRLGYGGGYFDRFLSASRLHAIGLVWQEAILPSLPLEPHDQPVSQVVSDTAPLTSFHRSAV
jgi:5-formyltetrahydrofolate cyclo-ligase